VGSVTLRRLGDAMTAAMETHGRNRVDGTLRPTRVEGRNADGTLSVRALDLECIATAPPSNLYVGQEYVTPPAAPFSMQGTAGIGLTSASRSIATMDVTSLDPEMYGRGLTYTVTVTGLGFTEGSVFEFLLPSTETINPGITITESRYVSATEFELDIAVAEDAAIIAANAGDMAFDNPGMGLF
jgi:hypothetical protein